MTHHFTMPSDVELKRLADALVDRYGLEVTRLPSVTACRDWLKAEIFKWMHDLRDRIKPVERLSESEIGLQAYQKSKALYGGVMVCDYVGGYRDGYRACEERLLDGK